jgi:hypothetical protein
MKIALIGGAAVIAATALATPAMAQAVIYEPGYCAQFYPSANCQNYGAGNPYTSGGYWGPSWQQGYAPMYQGYASMDRPINHRWYHYRRYRER